MIPYSRPSLGAGEAGAAARVIRAGRVGAGTETASFEREAAVFLGVTGAVAVNAGAAAMTLALRALGAGPGREVIVPAYAVPALLQAVLLTGAAPVPADVLWHDMNLSAAQVRRRLTHRTAAVAAVHGFGASVELEPLLRLGVPLVEDVSQAFGAHDYNRRKLGGFGRAAVASFRIDGLITSGGEGGMVFSNDRRLLDAVREAREIESGTRVPFRLDAGMTDLQAAVGRVQLARLPGFLSARRRWADRYRAALAGLPLEAPLQIYGRVYQGFVVKLRRPVSDALIRGFARRGVSVRRPVSRLFHWDFSGAGPFPVADRVWRRSLSLPLYPSMTEAEFRKIVAVAEKLI